MAGGFNRILELPTKRADGDAGSAELLPDRREPQSGEANLREPCVRSHANGTIFTRSPSRRRGKGERTVGRLKFSYRPEADVRIWRGRGAVAAVPGSPPMATSALARNGGHTFSDEGPSSPANLLTNRTRMILRCIHSFERISPLTLDSGLNSGRRKSHAGPS